MDPAASRLRAALGILQHPSVAPELCLLHAWADIWGGVGAIVTGLHRTGYDLHLWAGASELLVLGHVYDRTGLRYLASSEFD